MRKKNCAGCCLLLGLIAVGSGCVSIVDKDKSDGLVTMALWKADTTNIVNSASASQDKYVTAQKAVNNYIDGLTPIINTLEGEWFSKIDLSKTNIPPDVIKAVSDLKSSAGPYQAYGTDWGAVATAVYHFITGAISDYRKASGEALKSELVGYKWEDWSTIHKK